MYHSRGNAGIQNIWNSLNSIGRVKDDFCGQGGPLQDMLGVSKNAADGVGHGGHVVTKLLAKLCIVEDLDVCSEKNTLMKVFQLERGSQ